MSRELNDDTRTLIRTAVAAEHGPGGAHRARLRQKVLARVAAGGIVTLLGESAAQAGARSLSAVVASSLGVGVGVGLVLAGAAQLAFSPSSLPRSAPPLERPVSGSAVGQAAVQRTTQPNAELPMPSSAAPGVSSSLREVANLSSPPAPLKPSPAAALGSPLRAELDLMARVQEALRDNQGARALSLIATYDARHPSGTLENERLAAEVFAACQTGDRTRARRAAARFLARDGASSLAVRVRNACAYGEP